MDIQYEKEGNWRRIKPEQAKKVVPVQDASSGPRELDLDDLKNLLKSDDNE